MPHAMDKPIKRRGKQKVVALVVIASLLLVGIFIYVLVRANDRVLRTDRSKISTAPVSLTAFHDDIPLRGKVVPRDTILLDAASGGRIVRIYIEAGDMVKEGEPILEFSNTSLQLQVIQQESQLNQAITQLQSNEIALEQNKVNNERAIATLDYDIIRNTRLLKRYEKLLPSGYISANQRDQLRDQLDDAIRQRPLQARSNLAQEELRQRQLPLIQQQQAQLRKNLDVVRGKLDELVARAPVAGRVTDFDLKIGENRNAGDRLATIVPDTGIKISAEVDEYYLDRVRKDQVAQVSIDGKPWTLKVSRVYPQVKNGTFTVDLMFPSTVPAGLLPGQAILGRLTLGASTQALVLPVGGYLEQSGGFVFVMDANGDSARKRPVKFGRRTADQVEVLDGLKAGEFVVTSDYTGLDRIDRLDIN